MRSNTRPVTRARARPYLVASALAVVGLGALTACGSDPFAIKWSASPDTVLLYSIARPELGLPSAFDFFNRVRVNVESSTATGNWDVAVGTQNGQIVLLPPGAMGVTAAARVAPLEGQTFDQVTEAPADTALYSSVDPVPVEVGTVYVIRTNQHVGSFGSYCVYYAKMVPLEVDPDAGTLRFFYDASPACNNRNLIPTN